MGVLSRLIDRHNASKSKEAAKKGATSSGLLSLSLALSTRRAPHSYSSSVLATVAHARDWVFRQQRWLHWDHSMSSVDAGRLGEVEASTRIGMPAAAWRMVPFCNHTDISCLIASVLTAASPIGVN